MPKRKPPQAKPIDRITMLIQSGLGRDTSKLMWYRTVMLDPRAGFYNTVYREYAVEIFNNLLNYVLNDTQLYNRLRMDLLKDNRKLSNEEIEELLNNQEESTKKTVKTIRNVLKG